MEDINHIINSTPVPIYTRESQINKNSIIPDRQTRLMKITYIAKFLIYVTEYIFPFITILKMNQIIILMKLIIS